MGNRIKDEEFMRSRDAYCTVVSKRGTIWLNIQLQLYNRGVDTSICLTKVICAQIWTTHAERCGVSMGIYNLSNNVRIHTPASAYSAVGLFANPDHPMPKKLETSSSPPGVR